MNNADKAARINSKFNFAGNVFVDLSRGIAVGPFENSQAAMDSARVNGHDTDHVMVLEWVNAHVWEESRKLANG